MRGRETDTPSPSSAVTILICDPRRPERFVIRSRRPWTRFRVALRAVSLDRDLAAGVSPESHLLLAVRAQDLTSAASRETLRDNWQRVLTMSSRSPSRRHSDSLLNARIIEATPEIRHLLACLGEPVLSATQGLAMAAVLLTDGAGPLYNPQAAVPLRAALRDVTRNLDPSAVRPR
jgi:hypothetical protein